MIEILQTESARNQPVFRRISDVYWDADRGVSPAAESIDVRPGATGDKIVGRLQGLVAEFERLTRRPLYPAQQNMHAAFTASLLQFIYR